MVLAACLKRWERRYPKLTDWAEENIGQTLTFYRLPAWLEDNRYINMDLLKEQRKAAIKIAA